MKERASTSVKTICDNIEIVEKFKCKLFENTNYNLFFLLPSECLYVLTQGLYNAF